MKLQSGLVILKESLHTMSSGEENIARYILDHPERVMEWNISELAEACGGSPAGIVRLCKRLKMKGYNELKLRVAMDLSHRRDRAPLPEIRKNLSPEELQERIVENHVRSLRNISSVLSGEALSEAAGLIGGCRRLDIYGLGASGIAARDLFQKLCRLGLNASYVADSHMQITSACSLGEGDAFLGISYSGETEEVVRAARLGSEGGARGISLTRYGANSLEEICPVNLFTPMTESLAREAAMTSRIAQLTVIDILFSLVGSAAPERFQANLDRTRRALGGKEEREDG